MAPEDAIVEAACQRLRAVILTSSTTIAGLTPILFEVSLQAQFLIPMATSIVFGLALGTLLILFVVPSIVIMLESAGNTVSNLFRTNKADVGPRAA
jgi:multidrug efflux pump subunit AcrB